MGNVLFTQENIEIVIFTQNGIRAWKEDVIPT